MYQQGVIDAVDFYFAQLMAGLSPDPDADVALGAALVSRATGKGDVYLDLAAAADQPLYQNPTEEAVLANPPLVDWAAKLSSSPAVGRPGQFRPLILDAQHRLYLYRYWEYEKQLCDRIRKRVEGQAGAVDAPRLKASLDRIFPPPQSGGTDWQKLAAVVAVHKRFGVVSGGPGTGKTFAVAKILALLLEQAPHARLKILLAAPTGKAAARLAEAITSAKNGLDCPAEILAAIPTEAFTIHRLLKPIPDSPYFRQHAENPLDADVVVVDEASMVDLALMSKLMAAVPVDSRLILIGDKDQLASVEAGSVLGDICDRNRPHGFSARLRQIWESLALEPLEALPDEHPPGSGLQDSIVMLKTSYRFAPDSAISALSDSVNRGDVESTMALLKNPGLGVEWQEIQSPQELFRRIAPQLLRGYADCLACKLPAQALAQLKRFKILCAVNAGPLGVKAVNHLAEQVLAAEGLVRPNHEWYPGRPVLVTRNDYRLGLFNGDLGIALADPESGPEDIYVYFPGDLDHVRRFHPSRLPEHETVYAMTVHKSQGSEFQEVVLILPDKDYPLLTRELLYTAITRTREKISIWAPENVVRATVNRRIQRTSGLRDMLWGPYAGDGIEQVPAAMKPFGR